MVYHVRVSGVQPNQAWLTANGGIPIKDPLVDGFPVGDFFCRVGAAVGTGATALAIKLPRKPSGCITFNSSAGTLVYQTAADIAATTAASFVCRSLSPTTATLLIA